MIIQKVVGAKISPKLIINQAIETKVVDANI
jgi:hypothetical protein